MFVDNQSGIRSRQNMAGDDVCGQLAGGVEGFLAAQF